MKHSHLTFSHYGTLGKTLFEQKKRIYFVIVYIHQFRFSMCVVEGVLQTFFGFFKIIDNRLGGIIDSLY